jgi:hypothetical protein
VVSYGSDLIASSDGRDWVVFRGDEMARQAWPDGTKVMVSIDLLVCERQGSVNLLPGGGWSRIPHFGNVRLLEDAQGGHLIWRTALSPPDAGLTYTFSDAAPKAVDSAKWTEESNSVQVSPLTFPMSPVYSRVYSHVYSRGLDVRPDRQPRIFTARRRIAAVHREVKLPPIRLADYELEQ